VRSPEANVPVDASRLQVVVVTDEADAALNILRLRSTGKAPSDSDWNRLFQTEGYRRLQQRERSLNRPFDDSSFRSFILSDTLLRRFSALEHTLESWRRVDPTGAARRAFSYLPRNAVIRAKVYPVIKPKTNTFVFETRTNPAIFFYLDPQVPAAKFENTLTHELHHIGVGSVCPDEPGDSTMSPTLRRTLAWIGGFAEGRAVLAAAGGPDVYPHATSEAAERRTWDRDFANVGSDLQRIQNFFLDLLAGKLSDDEANKRGMQFISTDSIPQGAYYTLGWLMSATVEKEFGRAPLVQSLCDPWMFLSDYNRAAKRRGTLPLWSDAFIDQLRGRRVHT
jgi:hypothetical protein